MSATQYATAAAQKTWSTATPDSGLTTVFVVGTIVVVGAGTVVTDHKVNGKAILAGGVVALGLSALENINTRMAEMFAAMIFLTACYRFVPPLVQGLGYTGGKAGNDVTAPAAAAPAANTGGSTATPQNSGGATKNV